MQNWIQKFPTLDAKLQQMNKREQVLVGLAAVLVLITILYYLLWKPLSDGIESRQLQVDAQQELLTWVRENTGRYLAANKQGATSSNASMRGSITERVTKLASANKVEIARMQPQSAGLLVVIDGVEFNRLLRFIQQLQSDAGLQIEHIDATELDTPGFVRVRRLQVRDGASS